MGYEVSTIHGAQNSLTEMGYEVTTIHGAHNTVDQDKIVKEFKDGVTQVLISTDLLARGFDQEKVNVIVNYDLPVNFESHRSQIMRSTCTELVERGVLAAK